MTSNVAAESGALLGAYTKTSHETSTKDLKAKTLRGGAAKVGAQAASFVMRIGSLMILARVLDPKDFGLVGMVTVVTGVFGLFKDAGLSMVTVQRATITDEQVSTLFWINMLVGAGLAVLSVAIAPALVVFYREPRLFWVTIVLATGFIFNAAGVQHSALLQRQMRFGTLAAIEVARPHGNHCGGHRHGASRLWILGARRHGRDVAGRFHRLRVDDGGVDAGTAAPANRDALHDALRQRPDT